MKARERCDRHPRLVSVTMACFLTTVSTAAAVSETTEPGLFHGNNRPRRTRRWGTSSPVGLHLDLHPTAAAAEERRWRRLKHSVNGTTTSYSSSSSSFSPPSEWFLRQTNAVYATIPDKQDPRHRNNRQLHEFHSLRHLSRYERVHRMEQGLDLQIGWNGTYEFDEYHGDDDMDQLFRRFNDPKETSRDNAFNERLKDWLKNILEPANASNVSFNFVKQTRPSANASDYSRQRRLEKESSSSNGGQFNAYQSVPLSQGYGTHFANVWVGSPTPQRKTVIVDTGSHYTAFPCAGCQNCGGPHHTDPYFVRFVLCSFFSLAI